MYKGNAVFDFFEKCGSGNLPYVKKLIQENNYNYEVMSNGFNQACYKNKLQVVEYLIDKDLSIYNGLISVCKKGHLDILKFLFTQTVTVINPVILNDCLETACKHRQLKTVKFLIKRQPTDLNTAMSKTCNKGYFKIVKFLIKHHATYFNWGMKEACKAGHIQIVKLMIRKGANDFNGGFEKAFYLGFNEPKWRIIKLMVKKGANVLKCINGAKYLRLIERGYVIGNQVRIKRMILIKDLRKELNRYVTYSKN